MTINPSNGEPIWYLAAVSMFKNEALHLEEWLGFCVSEGIEHILLYNNSSTDNFLEVLQPWITAGIVELFDWPTPYDNGAQTMAHSDALRRLRGRARWAAFIDVDEFLFSPAKLTLPETLRQFECHAGVIVNWQCYGTSGRETRPLGLTIESYTHRANTDWFRNRRVKSIVDPYLAVEPRGPHMFSVQPGHSLVTEDLIPVRTVRAGKWRSWFRHLAASLPYLPIDPYSIHEPSTKQVSISKLRINHYVTRSQEDLQVKYKDRNSMRPRDRRSYSRYHDRNEVDDAILAGKAALVKQIIAKVRSENLSLGQPTMDKRNQNL